jgi:hypothetical protein
MAVEWPLGIDLHQRIGMSFEECLRRSADHGPAVICRRTMRFLEMQGSTMQRMMAHRVRG